MNHLNTLTPEERKEAFLETLGEVQSEFNKKGIDYRVIGSVAGHAYLEPDLPEGVPTLDFNRKGAVTPDQLVPDIDIIVPRADLPEARVLRSQFLEGVQPVKIGLANATGEIDYRPNEATSFLTHKDVAIPVDNDLLRAEEGVSLDGVPLKTIPVDTLAHTYGPLGGKIREKDLPVLKALIRKSDHTSDPRTEAFHQFQKKRRAMSPLEYRFSLAYEAFNSKAPRRLRNELNRVALFGADLLGLR